MHTIREWYLLNHPDYAIGTFINEECTFQGLYTCLENYEDVYEYIGVEDSLLRELIFEGLSDQYCIRYGYIYEQWLKGCDIRGY